MKCPYDAHNLHCGYPHCIEKDPKCMTAHVMAAALRARETPIAQRHHVSECPEGPRGCQGCSFDVDPVRRKLRPGDQPLPVKNDRPFCQDTLIDRISGSYFGPQRETVIADIERRKQVGIERYGTALQPFNGRDFLRDLYEEALDTAIYGEGVMHEAREEARWHDVTTLERMHNDVLRYIFYIKHLMSRREESRSI